MRVMILWSGGVESTSTIKHYLETTDHEIFAHYVHYSNSEGRLKHEDQAVRDLLPHLQAIRPFYFSTSRLELVGGLGLARDIHVLYPIGLAAMRHFHCSQLHRGLCMEDCWHRAVGHPAILQMGPNGEHRHAIIRRDFAPMLQYGEKLESVFPTLPEYYWPKARHWHNLGSLAHSTWSCRRPIDGYRCCICHSCLDRMAAQRGGSNIPEVQVMIDRDSSWRK